MTTLDTAQEARPGRTTNPLSVLATPWTVVVAVPLIISILDPERFEAIVGFAAGAFLSTLPYIAFAVILIAWLKAAGADSQRWLDRRIIASSVPSTASMPRAGIGGKCNANTQARSTRAWRAAGNAVNAGTDNHVESPAHTRARSAWS